MFFFSFRSTSLLFVAIVLAALSLRSAHAAPAVYSCDVESLRVSSTTTPPTWLINRDDVENDVDFLATLTTPTPSIIFSIASAEPARARGTFNISLNGAPVATLLAPSPAPTTISGLRTTCGTVNLLVIHSIQIVLRLGRRDLCDYEFHVVLQNPSCPAIVGDPQFAGLRGQSYQVHGISGTVYSLVSAPQYAMNARFEFIDGPRPCPIMPSSGRKSAACWSHPGSYLTAVGVRTAANDEVVVVAGSASEGFASVRVNGRDLAMDEMVELYAPVQAGKTGAAAAQEWIGFLVRNNTHEMTMQLGPLYVELENNDGFLNVRSVQVSSADWPQLERQHVHGLLGQTWQKRRYAGSVKEIEGEVDDYAIEGNELTGYSFVYTRFDESLLMQSGVVAGIKAQ